MKDEELKLEEIETSQTHSLGGSGEVVREVGRGKGTVYNEQQIKRELKTIHSCGCRYNERLKDKTDGSTCLGS